MKTSGLVAAIVLLLLTSSVPAESVISYTLELGGDNRAYLWEAGLYPPYTPGVFPEVCQGGDLNWAVGVTVSGLHNDPAGPGHDREPFGAAKLAFDLQLLDANGEPVAIGAAPMVCAAGHPGEPDALGCAPAGPGFWSSINDGDADGFRGQTSGPDPYALGSFAISRSAYGDQAYRLIDPIPGPNFDVYNYPQATGSGALVGFAAAYADFDFGTTYRAGVGRSGSLGSGCSVGYGINLLLFEGQISARDLPPGIYTLVLTPATEGNEILHGDIDCAARTFGGWGTFSAPANQVYGDSISFEVLASCPGPQILARLIFYNRSFYDGNHIAIDTSPVAGSNNDDDDAIDPTKFPLLPGDGLAQPGNWTGYAAGINGIMFDVAEALTPITAADFTFTNLGKRGTGSTPVMPADFLVRPGGGGISGSDRVVITFAHGALVDTWLKVEIGTGFGLPAPDVCWWGNARGDTGTPVGEYILINITDLLEIRDFRRPIGYRTTPDEVYDNDKNGLVSITDLLFVRDHQTNPLTGVWRIRR